jgi:hypothetical protein
MHAIRFSRKGLLLGAFVLAGLSWLGYALKSGYSQQAASTLPFALVTPSVRDVPTPAEPSLLPSAPLVEAAESAAATRVSQSLVATKQQRREEIAHQSASFPDMLAFVRWLLPSAKSGDTDAQLTIARTLEMCEYMEKGPGFDGKNYKEKLKDPAWNPQGMRPDFERFVAQCDPLIAASADEVGTAEQWKQKALEGGDAQALMEDTADANNLKSAEERVAEFRRALSTRDPKALGTFLTLYDNLGGNIVHDVYEPLAVWELALCKMGEDCTDQGSTFKSLCQNFDCPGANSVQNFFELKLSPQKFAEADARAQYFANNFAKGSDDWPEAQDYEKALRKLGASKEQLGDPNDDATPSPPSPAATASPSAVH